MDWLSGNNNLSGAVVNNFWRVSNRVTVYAGLQIPAENSTNDFAGILGFALNPSLSLEQGFFETQGSGPR